MILKWFVKVEAFLILVAALSAAQIPAGFVQVTATVPSLANGAYGASWTNLSSSSQLALLGGLSTFQQTVNGTFDANGSATMLLADTAQIIPSPSTWTFQFTFSCPTGSPSGGFFVAVAVTGGGGTEDISSQIIAALPTTPCGGAIPSAYVSKRQTTLQTLAGPLAWVGGDTGTPAETTLANLGGISSVLTSAQTMVGPLTGAGYTGPLTGTVGATTPLVGKFTTLTGIVQDRGGQDFNVIQYGATCDGTTDDTAGIQAALNAAASIGRGKGIVILPSNSTCVIASSGTGYITLPQISTLDLNGSDLLITSTGGGICSGGTNGAIRLQQNIGFSHSQVLNGHITASNTSLGCAVNDSAASNTYFVAGFHLSNVIMVGPGATTSAVGIYMAFTGDAVIERNVIQSFQVQLQCGTTCNNVSIHDNTFGGAATADTTSYSVNIYEGENVHIYGNNFETGPLGVYVGEYSEKVAVDHNWMGDPTCSTSTPYTWVYANTSSTGGGAVDVSNNWIYGCGGLSTSVPGYGIYFASGDTDGAVAEGNKIDSAYYGIYTAAVASINKNSFLTNYVPVTVLANYVTLISNRSQNTQSTTLVNGTGGGNNLVSNWVSGSDPSGAGIVCSGWTNSTIVNSPLYGTSCSTGTNVSVSANVWSSLTAASITASGLGSSTTSVCTTTGGVLTKTGCSGAVASSSITATGYATCVKSIGPPPVLGYCSTVVSSTGTCTCN